MSNDLERLLTHADGDGPSPEFVKQLRRQIVEATEPQPSVDLLSHPVEISVDTTAPSETSSRPWAAAAALALAAAVALIVGLSVVGSGDRDSELDVAEMPDEESQSTDAAEPKAMPLTVTTSNVGPGTYVIDTLGTPFTLEIDQLTGVSRNEGGAFVVAPFAGGDDDQALTITRWSSLSDPADPTRPPDATSSWPAADLAGWLDAATDAVIVTDPVTAVLGGRDATRVDIELAEGVECDSDCPWLGTNHGLDTTFLAPGSRYRIWIIGQREEDPIAVIAAIEDGGRSAWSETVDELLGSMVFGDTSPNPVRRESAGSVRLAAAGGIGLDLPESRVVTEPFEGFGRIHLGDLGGDVEIFSNPLSLDGEPILSSDAVVAALESERVSVTELAPTTVDGFATRRFELQATSNRDPWLLRRIEDGAQRDGGWRTGPSGQLWLVEHPQRGVVVISADFLLGQSAEPEAQIGAVAAWVEDVLGSFEFTR